jgi:hypothetical protein
MSPGAARAAGGAQARLDTAQTFTQPQTIDAGSAAGEPPLTIRRSAGEGEFVQLKQATGGTFIDISNDLTSRSGYTGVEVNKNETSFGTAPSFILAVAGKPKFAYNIDTHNVDLNLASSQGLDGPPGDMLRVSPNGQMWFGTAIGSPTLRDAVFSLSNKLAQEWGMTILSPDDEARSSAGMQVHQRGKTVSLGLYQRDGTRTTLVQMGGHSFGTDPSHSNTADFLIESDAAGGAPRWYISPAGGHYFGSSNVPADASDGFFNVPYVGGTPNRTPSFRRGSAPIGISGGRLWINDGSWYGSARANGPNTFTTNQTFADGVNFAASAAGGLSIGTSPAQKVGFFNARPVAQPALTYSRSGAGETPAAAAVRQALVSLGLASDGSAV